MANNNLHIFYGTIQFSFCHERSNAVNSFTKLSYQYSNMLEQLPLSCRKTSPGSTSDYVFTLLFGEIMFLVKKYSYLGNFTV